MLSWCQNGSDYKAPTVTAQAMVTKLLGVAATVRRHQVWTHAVRRMVDLPGGTTCVIFACAHDELCSFVVLLFVQDMKDVVQAGKS